MADKTSVSVGGQVQDLVAALKAGGESVSDMSDDIQAKFVQLNATVDAVLKDIEAQAAKTRPAITIDDTAVAARLEDVKAKLAELAARVTSAKLDVDDAAARAKLSAIEATLDQLDRKTSRPNVTIGGIADAEAKAFALETELDAVGKSSDSTSGKVSNLGAKAKESSGSDGMGALLTTAAVLSPAILEIGTVGAGVGAGLLASFGAAASGLGVFALAAEGSFSKVSAQADAMIAQFQKANQATVLPALFGAINLLPVALGDVEPLVGAAAHALEGLETSAKAALSGPFWQQFARFLASDADPAITAFGHAVGGLGTLFAGVTEAFQPLIADTEAGVDRLGARMTAFGQSASSSSGLAGFVSYVEREGPQVASALESLGSTFLTVTRDVSAFGPSTLDVVKALAQIVGSVGSVDPTLIQAAAAFLAVKKVTDLMPVSMKGVQAAFADLGNFGGLADGSVKAQTGLGGLVTKLGQTRTSAEEAAIAAEATGVAVEDAGADAAVAGVGFSSMLGPIGLVAVGIAGLVGLFDRSSSASKQSTTASQAAQTAAGQYAASFVQSLQSSGDSVSKQESAIVAQILSLQKLAAAAKAVGDTSNLAKYTQELSALGDQESQLEATTQGQAAATSESVAETNAALSPTQTLANYINGLSTSTSKASTDLANLTQALQVYEGNSQAAASATDSVQAAVTALGTQLAAGVTTATTNLTAAQTTLTQAQQQLATSTQSLSSAEVSAAQQTQSAQQQLVESEEALKTAEQSEEQAQVSLTQARQDAANAITNLNDQVADGALSQQQAAINVQNAQAALATAANTASNPTAVAQAQLNLAQAQQQVKDLGDQQAQLTQQQQASNKAGVNGSAEVVSAQTALQQSADGVSQAQEQQVAAQQAVTQAQVTGAQQIQQAAQQEASSQQAVAAAAQAVTTAVQASIAAEAQLSDAFNINTAGGLANSQAALAASSAIQTMVTSMAANGDTAQQIQGAVDDYIGQMDQAASQAGLTAPQIQAMNTQFGLTPKNTSLTIALVGASGVISQAQQVQQALQAAAQNYQASISIGAPSAAIGAVLGSFGAGGVSPGGPALIAESGGPEVVTLPDGQVRLVSSPTLAVLPAGTKVTSSADTAKLIAGTATGTAGLKPIGGANVSSLAGASLAATSGAAGGTGGTGGTTTAAGSGDLVVHVNLGNGTTIADALIPGIRQQLARKTSRNAVQARLTK